MTAARIKGSMRVARVGLGFLLALQGISSFGVSLPGKAPPIQMPGNPTWRIGNGCEGTCLAPCRLPSPLTASNTTVTFGTHVLSCSTDSGPSRFYWRQTGDGRGYFYPPVQVCPSDEGALCPATRGVLWPILPPTPLRPGDK